MGSFPLFLFSDVFFIRLWLMHEYVLRVTLARLSVCWVCNFSLPGFLWLYSTVPAVVLHLFTVLSRHDVNYSALWCVYLLLAFSVSLSGPCLGY